MLLLSRSTARKVIATATAAVAFAFLYEVTILDSRYAARQAAAAGGVGAAGAGRANCGFTATGYCKGTTTASGVNVRTGIAAADPDLLPGRVGDPGRTTGRPLQRDLHDHGHRPSGPGSSHRHLRLELQRGLALGRRDAGHHRAAPWLEPDGQHAQLIDRLFRRAEAAQTPLAAPMLGVRSDAQELSPSQTSARSKRSLLGARPASSPRP